MISTPISESGESSFITLNVGGTLFLVNSSVFNSLPSSLLAQESVLTDHYVARRDDYFFDRNPEIFSAILNFYHNGYLHIPPGICMLRFHEEMKYWRIESEYVCECCIGEYLDAVAVTEYVEKECNGMDEQQETIEVSVNEPKENEMHPRENDNTKLTPWRKFRTLLKRGRLFVWLLLEPENPRFWFKIPTILHTVASLLAILCFILSTVEEYMIPLTLPETSSNKSTVLKLPDTERIYRLLGSRITGEIADIYMVCNLYLTFDFLLRLISCPCIRKYMTTFAMIVDCLCTFFFYGIMIANYIVGQVLIKESAIEEYLVISFYMFLIFKFLFFLRPTRILRVTSSFTILQTLLRTMADSWRTSLMYFVLVFIATFFYGTLIFAVEISEPDSFMLDIPTGMWWALMTMTTIGYGDVHPISTFGYVVGIACAITGVIVTALPIAVLSGNFIDRFQEIDAAAENTKTRRKCNK